MHDFPWVEITIAKSVTPPLNKLRKMEDKTTESPTHVEALYEVPAQRRYVQFSTATTYIFKTAYGGSALPKDTGPAIGMSYLHVDEVVEDLHTDRSHRRSRVRRFNHLERIEMLKRAEYDVKEIATFCMDAIEIRKSRQETLDEIKQENKRKHDECEAVPAIEPVRRMRMFYPSPAIDCCQE
ncbi:unnamed protein product [Aphanomyces euteiches]|nr:hypothetical protein AeRB84_009564 [Aphanomyces euteiches]